MITTTKSIIAVSNSNNSPGITLNLESTGVFLGILVSVSALAGVAIRIISKMNSISASIGQIELALKEQASNAERIRDLDKRFDLHIQEYVNRKDVVQMVMGQLDQKIDRKFKRLLFYTRDIERYLQKDTTFRIRDYEEVNQEE
jgi:hypothetical protein